MPVCKPLPRGKRVAGVAQGQRAAAATCQRRAVAACGLQQRPCECTDARAGAPRGALLIGRCCACQASWPPCRVVCPRRANPYPFAFHCAPNHPTPSSHPPARRSTRRRSSRARSRTAANPRPPQHTHAPPRYVTSCRFSPCGAPWPAPPRPRPRGLHEAPAPPCRSAATGGCRGWYAAGGQAARQRVGPIEGGGLTGTGAPGPPAAPAGQAGAPHRFGAMQPGCSPPPRAGGAACRRSRPPPHLTHLPPPPLAAAARCL